MSIETLLDLDELSVEELVGRLKAAEERHDLSGGGSNITLLNLTEEELVARVSKRLQLSGGGTSEKGQGFSGGGGNQRRGRGRPRGKNGGAGGSKQKKADATGGGDVAKDECRYCGFKGHWARECRKKKRDEAAHLAQAEEENEGTLLMARVSSVQIRKSPTPPEVAATPAMPGGQV